MSLIETITGTSLEKITDFSWSPQNYYTKHVIPKSSGGKRWLFEPNDWLKECQYNILYSVIYQFKPHDLVFGFKRRVSLVEGARKHVGQGVLLNLDIKNFFPSIRKVQVINWAFYTLANLNERGLFGDYSTQDVLHLADLLCFMNGLPQGSPTSPALSNLIFRPLDEEIEEWCTKNGVTYTRYADDLSFSHRDGTFDIDQVALFIETLLSDTTFKLNPKKTRVMRPHNRMEVTGIVVNEKTSIARWKWRNLKAEIHNIVKNEEPITPLKFKQIKGKLSWLAQAKQWDEFPKWAKIDQLELLTHK